MINIYSNAKLIEDEHYNLLRSSLEAKIRKVKDAIVCDFLLKNLINILLGSPDELLQIHSEFNSINETRTGNKKVSVENIEKIFNYKSSFSNKEKKSYNAYDLAERMNVLVCPYCNEQYTITVVDEDRTKICRPAFDHYFPQSKYPILALSLYNLIPSCHICNSNIKSDKPFKLTTHIHPYKDNIINDFKFQYHRIDMSNIKIDIDYFNDCVNGKIEKTLSEFYIKDRYNYHRGIVEDMIELREMYSDEYLTDLISSYKCESLDMSKAYRLAFGTYLEDVDFVKRPLSKLKKDIAEQLKIIK